MTNEEQRKANLAKLLDSFKASPTPQPQTEQSPHPPLLAPPLRHPSGAATHKDMMRSTHSCVIVPILHRVDALMRGSPIATDSVWARDWNMISTTMLEAGYMPEELCKAIAFNLFKRQMAVIFTPSGYVDPHYQEILVSPAVGGIADVFRVHLEMFTTEFMSYITNGGKKPHQGAESSVRVRDFISAQAEKRKNR